MTFAPPFPARPGRLARAVLAACGLATLAGCGQTPVDAFAPPCPVPSIPRDFNDLHRFRGSGRDITDTALTGRITGVNGSCKRDGAGAVVADISVGIELIRGPALSGRTADVAYFVAVSEGDRILDKQVFKLHAEFPENTERLRLTGDDVQLRVPVTPKKPASAYRISVGFDVTPAELEFNRQRPAP